MRVLATAAIVLVLAIGQARAGDFEDGLRYYRAKEYAMAIASWEKAAAQGNVSAQFTLGFVHEKGEGTEVNFPRAAYWYRQAASAGNAAAQTNLGYLYETGRGVTQDNEQAVYWYQQAADQGLAEAEFNLGRMYQTGQGVQQDYTKAASWFRKAGEQGHVWASTSLGQMYETGQGMTQDYKQAVYWYRKAAEKGDTRAQLALARIYEAGAEGTTGAAVVPQDYVEARMWWAIAEANGEDEGRKGRILIERLMTPEQIAEAKKRTSAWMQAHKTK